MLCPLLLVTWAGSRYRILVRVLVPEVIAQPPDGVGGPKPGVVDDPFVAIQVPQGFVMTLASLGPVCDALGLFVESCFNGFVTTAEFSDFRPHSAERNLFLHLGIIQSRETQFSA